jgi:hypothetical protein
MRENMRCERTPGILFVSTFSGLVLCGGGQFVSIQRGLRDISDHQQSKVIEMASSASGCASFMDVALNRMLRKQ